MHAISTLRRAETWEASGTTFKMRGEKSGQNSSDSVRALFLLAAKLFVKPMKGSREAAAGFSLSLGFEIPCFGFRKSVKGFV
jgi:hypothetical protein